MWKRTLSAAIACLSLTLFIVPVANAAECACMCVEAEPMYVCTGGFVNSQTATDECTAQLQCPAVTDPPPDEVPPITHANNPDVPPGMECRPRNVWRPDLGRYTEYTVCSPQALVASNDDGQDGRHGRKHRKHKSDKSKKSHKSKKHRRHHRRHHHDDDGDDD